LLRLLSLVSLVAAPGGRGSSPTQEDVAGRKVPRNLPPSAALSEDVELLVRRAQAGDAAALEELVAELAPYLGRICGSIALDAGEDALQEALIAIVRNVASLREPEALRGWARTIAVREALRVARARRPVPTDPVELDAVAVPDLAPGVDVAEVLAGLQPHHRAVLVLRELEGMTEAEVAHVLGVSVGTVKSRTARAKDAFIRRWTA
jgi:DNA-directed RNA polymerase specialized sigma24 family protein